MTSFYGEYREKDIISDEEENRASRANVDKWMFRLLLIIIGFMPLVVLAYTEKIVSPIISNVPLLTSGTKGDLFTYYKSLIVLILTVIAGILLLAKIFFMNGKIRKTILNYFLGAFAFAIVMSTILSPNITIALNGLYNRSDGAISWLCYIALMFIAMNINYPKKAINYVMYTLMPFVFINLYIITMNFTGNDLMQKTWMQKLVTIFLPEGANLSEGSQLVGTLNQWNFMSGMFAIMAVMYLAWTFVEKSLVNSIIGLVSSIAAIAVMLMSISTSGFVTVVVLIPLLLVVLFKSNSKTKGLIAFVLFIVLSVFSLHILAKENPKVWDESLGILMSNPYDEKATASDFNTNYSVSLIDTVYAADNSFTLPKLPDKGWSAGSGRIYIWEKTFDSLKERPLFGYGLDSIMYNFPHYNIDARAGLNSEKTIVDKPHSLYLGIAYGTGFVGIIIFLTMIVVAALILFKFIFKNDNNALNILTIGITAYFVQGLFNDSLPGISAVIFVLCGIAISLVLQHQDGEQQQRI